MMRIAVIDDVGGSDDAMPLALGAERMASKEPQPCIPPACRSVEYGGDRIAVAGVVPVALLLFPPADRAVDRRADRHGNRFSETMVVMSGAGTATPAMDISVTGAALASIGII